jgi:hypothetical protein
LTTPRKRSLRSRFRGDPGHAALFLTALVGVVAVVAIALSAWTLYALIPYAALLALAALAVVRRARALRRPHGRTCDCCTSTVHDPVKVI